MRAVISGKLIGLNVRTRAAMAVAASASEEIKQR